MANSGERIPYTLLLTAHVGDVVRRLDIHQAVHILNASDWNCVWWDKMLMAGSLPLTAVTGCRRPNIPPMFQFVASYHGRLQ